jgi:hypothetical protein
MLSALSACGDKDDDEQIYKDEPDTAITKPSTVPATSNKYPHVAGRGILWKPSSDNTGKLAVLLNPSYGSPQVQVKNRTNHTVAVGTFNGYSNSDRATYRFSVSGSELGRKHGTVFLVVGSKVFMVPDPAQRYE